jgi:hypothetical protein
MLSDSLDRIILALDSLNRIALARALKPDSEGAVRRVMRWYSKTFSTPLHVVMEEIPLEDIWLAYFEEEYEGLSQFELQQRIALALETPEERKKRLAEEEAEEASERAFAEMTAAAAQAPTPLPVNPAPAELLKAPELPEATLPAPVLEEGIEMTFVDASPEEMEALLSGGMGTQTK